MLTEPQSYRCHRANAKRCGNPFRLTFEEWTKVWRESGHSHERGTRKGKYVMARLGDKGAYEVGNIKIILHSENAREAWIGRKHSKESCDLMSKSALEKYQDPEMRLNHLRVSVSPEYRRKLREGAKRRRQNDPFFSEKMRKNANRRWHGSEQ